MNNTNLTVIKHTVVKSQFRYRLKIQLFSTNTSHNILPNVEVWEDIERGVESFSKGLRFETLGREEITLENTDMAILFYFPETNSYKVEGTRKNKGAIGTSSPFYVFVRAENEEQAEEIARQGSYICDYEHVNIRKVELENK